MDNIIPFKAGGEQGSDPDHLQGQRRTGSEDELPETAPHNTAPLVRGPWHSESVQGSRFWVQAAQNWIRVRSFSAELV